MMSMGTMGSAPPSAAPSELSILRALARLLDPEADEAIAAVAAAQPRDDVRRAVEGMAQLVDLIRSMTPIEAAVAAAIEDIALPQLASRCLGRAHSTSYPERRRRRRAYIRAAHQGATTPCRSPSLSIFLHTWSHVLSRAPTALIFPEWTKGALTGAQLMRSINFPPSIKPGIWE
jgi:hypothetical protein